MAAIDAQVLDVAFASFRKEIEDEQTLREDIREVVRRLDQEMRELQKVFQKVHHSDGSDSSPEAHAETVKLICANGKEILKNIKGMYAELAALIPVDEYYKYHDHHRFATQRISFIVCLLVFLDSETLCTREHVAEQIGINVARADGFHLDLEDYLHGLLTLASELSRLCLNAVSRGDMAMPFRISAFLCDLDAGFRLLNLKNDSLRKRFDALKYDVRRVEEVVYDLTVRDLKPKQ